jgi:hypothetical protein
MSNLSQDKKLAEKLRAVDVWYWIANENIKLESCDYEIRGHEYQVDWLQCDFPKQVFKKAAQMTVPIAIDTPIPTPDGWVNMEDIKVGDEVFGNDGKIWQVTYVTPIQYEKDCYEIEFSDGSKVVCDDNHLWSVTDENRYIKHLTLSTKEIRKNYKNGKRNRFAIDVTLPLELPEKKLIIDPYILGLWLGDGNRNDARMTAHINDANEYKDIFKKRGIECIIRANDKRHENNRSIKFQYSRALFRQIGVLFNKHIPIEYLRASYQQRLDLLAGLMDSDGNIDLNGRCFFSNMDKRIIDNVYELLMTLGIKARIKNIGKDCRGWHGEDRKTDPKEQYRIYFTVYQDKPVFKLTRKLERLPDRINKRTTETERRRIINIKKVSSVPVRCISVNNPIQLFLVGESMIPTHNTTTQILRRLHDMIYGRYKSGVLYLFPTRDDVTDFSKGRFQPIITNNPQIAKYVKDTDAANIKRVGKSMLYLRGARSSHRIEGIKETSSQLKSIPVDCIVFDEKDEMSQDMVQLAMERISHSDLQEEISISTPTIPDYGIDKDYMNSDQRVWEIKCRKCGEFTCLELEFPECLIELNDGTVKKVCVRCKNEVYSSDGQWIAQTPSKSKELVGWWISQLNSRYINPKLILELYKNPPNGNLTEVYNSKLGMAYVAAENRLTKGDIYSCCGKDVNPSEIRNTCAMGVDVGNELHVVIGYPKENGRYRIIYIGRLSSFDDVHDMAKKYNVKCAVIDMEPETRKVRDFKKAEPYGVYLCDYQERLKVSQRIDERDGVITVRRTETMDNVNNIFSTSGKIEIPRRNSEIDQYAFEMSNTAKVLQEDEITGSKRYIYTKLGADHYFHATNYFLLACSDMRVIADNAKTYAEDYLIDEKANVYDPFAYINK